MISRLFIMSILSSHGVGITPLRFANVVLMPGQRRRRWHGIKPTFNERLQCGFSPPWSSRALCTHKVVPVWIPVPPGPTYLFGRVAIAPSWAVTRTPAPPPGAALACTLTPHLPPGSVNPAALLWPPRGLWVFPSGSPQILLEVTHIRVKRD